MCKENPYDPQRPVAHLKGLENPNPMKRTNEGLGDHGRDDNDPRKGIVSYEEDE